MTQRYARVGPSSGRRDAPTYKVKIQGAGIIINGRTGGTPGTIECARYRGVKSAEVLGILGDCGRVRAACRDGRTRDSDLKTRKLLRTL
jgi:hypothetical protein